MTHQRVTICYNLFSIACGHSRIVFVHVVWGYPPKAGLDKWNGVKTCNFLNLRNLDILQLS